LRHLSAILLLIVFSLSPIAPLLGADDDSNLPACCRRGGKHHCSMIRHSGSSSDSVEGAALNNNGRCPSYPGFAPGTFPIVAGVAPAAASAAVLAARRASCRSFELRVLSSLRLRAHSKRGPPVFV
jgi:hypothetical protein